MADDNDVDEEDSLDEDVENEDEDTALETAADELLEDPVEAARTLELATADDDGRDNRLPDEDDT